MRTIAQAQTTFALTVRILITAVEIIDGQDYPPDKDDLAYLVRVMKKVKDIYYLKGGSPVAKTDTKQGD